MNKLRSEIVAFAETLRTLAIATIGVLDGFGAVHLTPTQVGLVLSWFATLSVTLSAIARAGVVPSGQVALTNDQAAALNQAPPNAPTP